MLPCLNFAVVLCVFQVLCITADIDTSSFLIFNEEHNKCIKVESATSITVDDCNPYAKDQQFRWVSESHLFSLSLKLCLGTTAIEDGVIVQFMKCDESNDLQHWQCKNDTLFGLKDQDLHLNWGHRHDERVMIHKGSGTWSRWRIYGTQGDLCSKGYQVVGPTAPPQLPGNCPQSTSRGTWIPFSGHCYSFFSSVTNDWAHATTECIKMGASLVSIQDPIESKFIEENVEILQDSAKTFWIGMYKTHEDKWMWIDNSPLDYTNWKSGMAQSESCVYISSDTGLWSTTYCRKSFSYICKTPKVIKPTEKPPFVAHVIQETTHGSAGIIVAIVLIVIAIVGLGAFLLFRKRIPRIPALNLRESTFDNKLYFNNPNRAAVDTKGLVANIEQNEQA